MGIYMAGLDIIDEKIIEINVTSPCYFIKEINNNFCTNIEKKIVDYIEEKIAKNIGCKIPEIRSPAHRRGFRNFRYRNLFQRLLLQQFYQRVGKTLFQKHSRFNVSTHNRSPLYRITVFYAVIVPIALSVIAFSIKL